MANALSSLHKGSGWDGLVVPLAEFGGRERKWLELRMGEVRAS